MNTGAVENKNLKRPVVRPELKQARLLIEKVPPGKAFELTGRPTVLYEVRDYTTGDKAEQAKLCRGDAPYLFKSFETGQSPPPRPGSKNYNQPRAATIHEYLDWTVTAEDHPAQGPGGEYIEYVPDDFSGFRVIALVPRMRPQWPAPGMQEESPATFPKLRLGAPKAALPVVVSLGKATCAATIRVGLGYLEVPFVATMEARRGKGHGRALVEAVEEVARCLGLPRLLLCSTDDPNVKGTWRHLGFHYSTEQDLKDFGVQHGDLLHMDNTVQMHKVVPPAKKWRSIVIKHEHLRQRIYCQNGFEQPQSEQRIAVLQAAKQAAIAGTRPAGQKRAAPEMGAGTGPPQMTPETAAAEAAGAARDSQQTLDPGAKRQRQSAPASGQQAASPKGHADAPVLPKSPILDVGGPLLAPSAEAKPQAAPQALHSHQQSHHQQQQPQHPPVRPGSHAQQQTQRHLGTGGSRGVGDVGSMAAQMSAAQVLGMQPPHLQGSGAPPSQRKMPWPVEGAPHNSAPQQLSPAPPAVNPVAAQVQGGAAHHSDLRPMAASQVLNRSQNGVLHHQQAHSHRTALISSSYFDELFQQPPCKWDPPNLSRAVPKNGVHSSVFHLPNGC